MNVRPGDLAITVPSPATPERLMRNTGRIVRVVEFVGLHQFERGPLRHNVWWCESESVFIDASGQPWSGRLLIDDMHLRPIRDSGAQDEMLRIAGLPQKETA